MAESHPIPSDRRFKDFTGQRFGKLTVVSYAGRTAYRQSRWLCACDCGSPAKLVARSDLTKGTTVSCGCYGRTQRIIHGKSETPEFRAWKHMIARCSNPGEKSYKDYGGRGISVCSRWKISFQNFFADVGPRPTPKHQIDRINNDGNYEPGNCRWATILMQANNKRNNRWLTHNGQTLTIGQWARKTGITVQSIHSRINRGYSTADVLFVGRFKSGVHPTLVPATSSP